MTDYCNVINDLLKEIEYELPQKRLDHTRNVLETSLELIKKYGGDRDKAELIALAHDRFRDVDDNELNKLIDKYGIDSKYKNNNALAHGKIAAEYVRDKYGIADEDILNSIRYHTTGRKGMSLQEKIIFLADAIEKDRVYPGADEVRKATEKGLDNGVEESLRRTVEHLKEEKRFMDNDTLEALSWIRSEKGGEY